MIKYLSLFIVDIVTLIGLFVCVIHEMLHGLSEEIINKFSKTCNDTIDTIVLTSYLITIPFGIFGSDFWPMFVIATAVIILRGRNDALAAYKNHMSVLLIGLYSATMLIIFIRLVSHV